MYIHLKKNLLKYSNYFIQIIKYLILITEGSFMVKGTTIENKKTRLLNTVIIKSLFKIIFKLLV